MSCYSSSEIGDCVTDEDDICQNHKECKNCGESFREGMGAGTLFCTVECIDEFYRTRAFLD